MVSACLCLFILGLHHSDHQRTSIYTIPSAWTLFSFTLKLVNSYSDSTFQLKDPIYQCLLTWSNSLLYTGSRLWFTFIYIKIWSMSTFLLDCKGPELQAELPLLASPQPTLWMAWVHGLCSSLENKWIHWTLLFQCKIKTRESEATFYSASQKILKHILFNV